MALGQKLQSLLTEKDITVKDFANKIQVPPTTLYSFIKRDSDTGKLVLIKKICDGLEMDLEDFLSESNNLKVKTETTYIQNADGGCYQKTEKRIVISDKAKYINYYDKLNRHGQREALKRIAEMTKLPEYTTKSKPKRKIQEYSESDLISMGFQPTEQIPPISDI